MEAVDLGQTVPLIPLQVDPPDHSKYRKLLDPIFAPKQMNMIEPDIARLVNELIDAFIDTGSCEFTTALAEPCRPRCSSGCSACPCRIWTCSWA